VNDEFFWNAEEFTCVAVDLTRDTPKAEQNLTNTQPQGFNRTMGGSSMFCTLQVTDHETFIDLLKMMIQIKKTLVDQAEFISGQYFQVEASTAGFEGAETTSGAYLADKRIPFTSLPCFESVLLVRI
jgi:hypothetical protein